MNMQIQPDTMIEQPDGSMIAFEKLKPATQVEHEMVMGICAEAEALSTRLRSFKAKALASAQAAKTVLFETYDVKKGGKKGNMTFRSACGRHLFRLSVPETTSFGKELEAAKALIQEYLTDELTKGGSPAIRDIIMDVFKLNGDGRLDTDGILNLRKHPFTDPRWKRAMEAIDNAVIKDPATVQVYFYNVDPHAKPKSAGEQRISLNIAEM